MKQQNNNTMSKQKAVTEIGLGRYELRNYEFPDRPGQIVQFMEKLPQEGSDQMVVAIDGTTIDDLLKLVVDRLEDYQDGTECYENSVALVHIKLALEALKMRRKRRKQEGTLGTAAA